MDATSATPAKDETRDLAYQLWAFVASRNAVKVASILEQEHQISVPVRTLQDWVTRYNWPQRAADDVASIAPDLRYQAFSELLFAGLDGAKYIRSVASGQEDHPDLSDILERDDISAQDRNDLISARIRAHDIARKARLTASLGAVDRIGFSPIGKGEPASIAPPNATKPIEAGDMAGLSPDELIRRESEFRSSRRSRT